jgi:DNA invertase Pin-like site-specific DNA recombinase
MVTEPAAYPWSSYRATVGLVKHPSWLVVDWIVAQFGADSHTARRRYAEFVVDGRNASSPMTRLRGHVMLGGTAFAEAMRAALDRKTNLQEIPRAQRLAHRPTLAELFPEPPRIEKSVRDTTIARAHRDFGYSLAAIARAVGLHYSTVSRIVNGER